MARLAFYFCHDNVRAMGKKNVWRQAPHSLPWDLFSFLTVVFKFLYLRTLGISRMAPQAQCRRRPPCDSAFLRALMAGRAGKVEIHMGLVRKCDRLLDIRVRKRPVTPS
jgi:hypothetical protein